MIAGWPRCAVFLRRDVVLRAAFRSLFVDDWTPTGSTILLADAVAWKIRKKKTKRNERRNWFK